MMRLGLLG